jgi:hypothetical protein
MIEVAWIKKGQCPQIAAPCNTIGGIITDIKNNLLFHTFPFNPTKTKYDSKTRYIMEIVKVSK